MIQLLHGDCLELMRQIPVASVDMILADLPYGTTQNKWDAVIPFEPLWEQYRRIIKKDGVIVLTACQPFSSALVMSQPDLFRYEWIWQKTRASGHLNAKKLPMRAHEQVLVFGGRRYLPQMEKGEPYKWNSRRTKTSGCYGEHGKENKMIENDGSRFPRTVQTFKNETGLHPTQKPVALLEYLIRTYTNEGDTVLDNVMGSGSTMVACQNTSRRGIGIEKDAAYFEIARRRIEAKAA